MVVGYNSSTGVFTLANPWGFANPGPLSWGQLEASCQAFVVADASGTVPAGLPLAAMAVDSVFAGLMQREVTPEVNSLHPKREEIEAGVNSPPCRCAGQEPGNACFPH